MSRRGRRRGEGDERREEKVFVRRTDPMREVSFYIPSQVKVKKRALPVTARVLLDTGYTDAVLVSYAWLLRNGVQPSLLRPCSTSLTATNGAQCQVKGSLSLSMQFDTLSGAVVVLRHRACVAVIDQGFDIILGRPCLAHCVLDGPRCCVIWPGGEKSAFLEED